MTFGRLLLLFLLLMLPMSLLADLEWRQMRRDMMKEIAEDARYSQSYTGRGVLKPEVMKAVEAVERHQFVPPALQSQAYRNHPLPIGYGQTISQPFIVALMTDLLDVQAGDKVLEVGTGSGYQAAVLAELVAEVYTIEIVESLARSADKRLSKLGYDNVTVRSGDGTLGWPIHAPFDGIMVTAAGLNIPQALIDQLKPGGRLVMPVGGQFETQQLLVLTRHPDGTTTTEQKLPVRFVPITH